ncbi:MAG TPA: hypothetical protein VM324_13295 [Egibacteraceae bacterium]|nr:hypothetical protein [Egibacteraceae bacterium]
MTGAAVLAAAAAAGVVAARRTFEKIAPPPDLSGSPVPLETPLRAPLGSARDARTVPPSWEPPALAALARWEPPAPRHVATRVAAYAWAAPLTVPGLVAGCLSGVRPRPREGVLLFSGARGLTAALLRRHGYAAVAIGHVVICLDEPTPPLLAHELVHVRHAERLGALAAPLYLGLLAVYGYARHPLERAARRAARRVAGAP